MYKSGLCKFVTATSLILLPRIAASQPIPIHNHWQKATYASPAEWPTVSCQGHWGAPGVNPMYSFDAPGDIVLSAMPSHAHNDLTVPTYGEVAGPFTGKFALKLFHTSGGFGLLISNSRGTQLAHDIAFDTPSPLTSPFALLVGDGMGLRTWTGHFTMEPDIDVTHGWFDVVLSTSTRFDNGDVLNGGCYVPLYSMVDPRAPEFVGTQGGYPLLRSQWEPHSVSSGIDFGSNLIEFHDPIPIAALTEPWRGTVWSAGYGANTDGLPPASLCQRHDLDIHNGVPGIIDACVSGSGNVSMPITIDPSVLAASTPPAGSAPGDHVTFFGRLQTDPTSKTQINSILVVHTPVGNGVTPSTPPAAPSPSPSPAPGEDWHVVAVLFSGNPQTVIEQFGAQNRYRINVKGHHILPTD